MREIVFAETAPGMMSALPSRSERARIRRMMAERASKRRQLGESIMGVLVATFCIGGFVFIEAMWIFAH